MSYLTSNNWLGIQSEWRPEEKKGEERERTQEKERAEGWLSIATRFRQFERFNLKCKLDEIFVI